MKTVKIPSIDVPVVSLPILGVKSIGNMYTAYVKVPTPDCYYDFSIGSNDSADRETVKDLSGNGKNAKIYNSAFSGMSGYGGYSTTLNKNTFVVYSNANLNVTYTPFKATLKPSVETGTWISNNFRYAKYDAIKLRFKTNIDCVFTFNKRINGVLETGNTINVTANKETIIELPDVSNVEDITQRWCYWNTVDGKAPSDSLIIELLPEYPGSLVLDGVDDYVALEAFDSGFKTVFMVCNPFNITKMLYDQRVDPYMAGKNVFGIYNESNTVAYSSRNPNGFTYINGTELNIIADNLLNKKQCITVLNPTVVYANTKRPVIGKGPDSAFNGNMAIYKFLGFKDALTEEQIQAVIKKYNLLDKVDEI